MPELVYFLNLQVEGHCRMMQNGDFSIVDSTEPYINDHCSDSWTQHSFRIPKAILQPLMKQPGRLMANKISSSDPLACLATDYLSSIAMNAEHLDAAASLSITNHLVELVALVLGVSDREGDRARGTLRNQLAFFPDQLHHFACGRPGTDTGEGSRTFPHLSSLCSPTAGRQLRDI